VRNDNHGFYGISHNTSRTFVLATNLTKVAILEAMKHRRTYAALDKNIHAGTPPTARLWVPRWIGQ